MSFAVSLTTDMLAVDAGNTTPLGIGVSNKGSEPDLFEVLVEGLDPTWATAPVESFSVGAGESVIHKVVIRVPRVSESAAGAYPFVLKVRSLNSGDAQSCQGMLEVKPFHQLSMDVEPKRLAMGGLKPQAEFEVNVINLSNIEHELQLFASDPENECAFEFEPEKLRIGPGQQRVVTMTATSRKKALLANGKLYGVNVSARSVSNPTVAAYTQVQLELRPLASPAPVIAVLAVAAIGFAWFATIPRPPKVTLFKANKEQLRVGEELTLNYQTTGASAVTLFVNDELLVNSQDEVGNFKFSPRDPGQYTLRLEAKRQDKSESRLLRVEVLPALEAPKPEITDFDVNATSVTEDDTLTVTFKVGPGTTRIELRPIGLTPNPDQSPLSFKPNWMGKAAVTLIAYNSAGESVQRSIDVTVKPAPEPVPTVVTFTTTPARVFGVDARTVVRWTFRNCVRAELEWNGEKFTIDPNTGSRELVVTGSGPVVLRGWDADGKVIEQRRMIEWSAEEPDPASPGGATPPPASNPGGGPDSGSGANPGAGTGMPPTTEST